MMNAAFQEVIAATDAERRDLFLSAAVRLGTTLQNIEKDFWVCWTLDALFNGLRPGGPRLLFKGGTSLSKGYGLIARFSEDIDVTVFRDDLGTFGSAKDLAGLSGKKRAARIDAIKAACQAYLQGPLLAELGAIAARTVEETHGEPGRLRVEVDEGDPDHQSLLLWYPSMAADDNGYVRPAVKIESGAKSALDPHTPVRVKPYIIDDLPATLDLSVPGITTVDPARTFWDKVIILHGLRGWYEHRGELRGGGQRVSRHYYDVHQLLASDIAAKAVADIEMATDCANHARLFFNRPDLDLATASPGSLALAPHDDMIAELRRDYAAMATMIFGLVPSFDEVLASINGLEAAVNGERE